MPFAAIAINRSVDVDTGCLDPLRNRGAWCPCCQTAKVSTRYLHESASPSLCSQAAPRSDRRGYKPMLNLLLLALARPPDIEVNRHALPRSRPRAAQREVFAVISRASAAFGRTCLGYQPPGRQTRTTNRYSSETNQYPRLTSYLARPEKIIAGGGNCGYRAMPGPSAATMRLAACSVTGVSLRAPPKPVALPGGAGIAPYDVRRILDR